MRENWEQLESIDDAFKAIDEDFWRNVDEIVKTLKPLYDATKAMEHRNFCYTDLYLWSMRISFHLDEIIDESPQFDLPVVLKSKIKERERSLFETPIFMAALFLDPRFKSQLNTRQKYLALETLQNLYEQIRLRARSSTTTGLNHIDRRIEAQLFPNIQTPQSQVGLRAELTMAIPSYEAVQVTDINQNAIQFWKGNKHSHPLLYELATVVFGISSSICEAERTFSAFAYIYNARRMSLLPNNVTNILMIRLNKDLFYRLRQAKIDDIKTT